MNQTIGKTAREEIRNAMRGLAGKTAKSEAVRLAAAHNLSWQYVYRITQDLRGGTRKTRSDAGKRTFEIKAGTDTYYAAQLVIVDKLDPDQALLTARLRGRTELPTLATFQQLLRENGLGKKQRRTGRRAHRRWEAEFPGQIFQIDVTALKARWEDEKTRRIHRIEGIDKNHPLQDKTKLRVWQIMLIDDHSRRRFLRYVATTAITSFDMVRFEVEAFQKLGVPHILYTDNGSEFKGQHLRAERILNELLADQGGYTHERHAAGNPQATGKVEGAHKWAEKMDRLVGLAVSEGQKVDLDTLNRFADEICAHYDYRIHRSTGEKPINRWHGKRIVVRTLSPDVVESALLSDEFEVVLNTDMTVTHRGVAYKVPNAVPFVDYVGRKVRVVVPPSIAMILMTLPNIDGKFEPTNGGEFNIQKVVAGVDTAGEFKTVAESRSERLKRELKESRKQEIKDIKEAKRLTGEIAPVPHINVAIDVDKASFVNFPHREFVVSPERVAEVVSLPDTDADMPQVSRPAVAKPSYAGRPIGFWQSVAEYGDRFASKNDAKDFFEETLFPNREGELPSTLVEQAIDRYFEPQQEEFVPLRLAG